MKRLLAVFRWEIQQYESRGLYWTGFVVLVGAVVLQCWPSVPGVAIGLLGLTGAIMAIRAEDFKNSRREEFVWILVATALVVWEIRAIIRDRNEHDRQQAEL